MDIKSLLNKYSILYQAYWHFFLTHTDTWSIFSIFVVFRYKIWYTACFWTDIFLIIRLSIMKKKPKAFITISIVQFFCLWCSNVRNGHSVRIWKTKTLVEIIFNRSTKSTRCHHIASRFSKLSGGQTPTETPTPTPPTKDWPPTFSNWPVQLKFRENPVSFMDCLTWKNSIYRSVWYSSPLYYM